VETFVFRLLLLLALRKQLLCAFLSLIFLCGMMPFFVVGVLPMLKMQDATFKGKNNKYNHINCQNEERLREFLRVTQKV
jgi:hypothetical protein